jgi:hypothetical protein
LTFNGLLGVISQNMELVINTAVRTSGATIYSLVPSQRLSSRRLVDRPTFFRPAGGPVVAFWVSLEESVLKM